MLSENIQNTLKVLVLLPYSENNSANDTNAEALIKDSLGVYTDNPVVDSLRDFSPKDLRSKLENFNPNIVHIAGSVERGLNFKDDTERSKKLTPSALRKIFSPHRENLECIIQCSHFSYAEAKSISSCIKYVIGVYTGPKTSNATKGFITDFYKSLGRDVNYENAFKIGKDTYDIESDSDSQVNTITPILIKDNILFASLSSFLEKINETLSRTKVEGMYYIVFRKTCKDLDRLQSYKVLHDLILKDLQSVYLSINLDFINTHNEEHKNTFLNHSDELCDIIWLILEAAQKTYKVSDWIEDFKNTYYSMRNITNNDGRVEINNNIKLINDSIEQLRYVINNIPNRVSEDLIKELENGSLNTFIDILKNVSAEHITEEINWSSLSYDEGMFAFEEIMKSLEKLIHLHRQWQTIDNNLYRLKSIQNNDRNINSMEFRSIVRRLPKQIDKLYNSHKIDSTLNCKNISGSLEEEYLKYINLSNNTIEETPSENTLPNMADTISNLHKQSRLGFKELDNEILEYIENLRDIFKNAMNIYTMK